MMMRKWFNRRLRRGALAGHGGASERAFEAPVEPTIEIDRWQLTGILGAVLVACALSFFAGVLVGKKSYPPAQNQSAEMLPPSPQKPAATSSSARNLAMAEVSPGTDFIDHGLAQPVADPVPSDPTDAARIETHRQLQDFRAAGRRDVVPPAIGGGAALPEVVPVIADLPSGAGAAGASGQRGYTLQISVFESQAAAQAMAGELEAAGQPVHLRQMSAQGKVVYRVEVGDFRTAEVAAGFQRRFERESGYSAVLVPMP
ncbi:MAG: SPOR domain-containing protein [Myxococcota bacterium]